MTQTQRPVLVLLHGFVQNHRQFERQITHFSHDYTVVPLELRGHGAHSGQAGPFGNEEYTDDVQRQFDALGLQQVLFLGTHTGAAVGINLVLRDPRYIRRLVLEAPVIPGMPTPAIKATIDRTRQVMHEQGLAAARQEWLENSGWYAHMNQHPRETRKSEQRALIDQFSGGPWACGLPPRPVRDRRDELASIRCDCLVFNGAHDMPEFLAMSQLFADRTGCRREIIPDAGGFPLWENPDYVHALIDAWLNDVSG